MISAFVMDIRKLRHYQRK